VPRYKVLSVGKVMREASAEVKSGNVDRCSTTDKLDSLIDLATQSKGPLAVVDETGQVVGEIDQTIILKAMDSRS